MILSMPFRPPPKDTCRIKNCNRRMYSCCFCRGHYMKMRRWGTVAGPKRGRIKTHGMSTTRFYRIFIRINQRVKDDPRYRSKGIKVLWERFDDFKDDLYESYQDHVERHGEKNTTIDRIDGDGHYCRENRRWATYKEQLDNRCCTVLIESQGTRMSIARWSELTGISEGVLRYQVVLKKKPLETLIAERARTA